jgi:L-ascorbate metabolism protein UlaG (beta-lactamase superfamily)
MQRTWMLLLATALIIIPGIAAAAAPAGTQPQPPAQHEPPAPPPAQLQPQPQPQAGVGMTCPMMTPEHMKQMQEKMGQCCTMQPGKGCPMHQQMQKQLDELRQRLAALEKQVKGKKK